MKRRSVMGVALLVLIIAGYMTYRPGDRGLSSQAGIHTEMAPVVRNTEATIQALAGTALYMGIRQLQLADAWLEPDCDGVGLFLKFEGNTMWVWYDLASGKPTEHLVAEDVLEVVREKTPVETNAHTWNFHDGPGHRLRYYLGTDPEGQMVLVRFKTEECDLAKGYVERTPSVDQPGRLREVAFAPRSVTARKRLRYQDLIDSKPEAPRHTEETDEARDAASAFAGLRNYVGDSWVEKACDQVFVFQYTDDDGDWAYYFSLYDLKSKRIIEHITHVEILDAVRAQWSEAELSLDEWHPWLYWQDAPGRRTRYRIGYIGPREAWLHFGTKECSLLPVQVQLARGSADMGEWVTLPITDASVRTGESSVPEGVEQEEAP